MQYLRINQNVDWEGQVRHTYGIVLQEGEQVLDQIGDVCVDAEQTERLVSILNQNEVSSVHFRDVIYDLVSEL